MLVESFIWNFPYAQKAMAAHGSDFSVSLCISSLDQITRLLPLPYFWGILQNDFKIVLKKNSNFIKCAQTTASDIDHNPNY